MNGPVDVMCESSEPGYGVSRGFIFRLKITRELFQPCLSVETQYALKIREVYVIHKSRRVVPRKNTFRPSG